MINLRGLTRVAAELGISRESLARYLARLDVQAGTLALIESKLAANDVDPAPTATSCPRCGSTDRNYRPTVTLGSAERFAVCAHGWHEHGSTGGGNALPG